MIRHPLDIPYLLAGLLTQCLSSPCIPSVQSAGLCAVIAQKRGKLPQCSNMENAQEVKLRDLSSLSDRFAISQMWGFRLEEI